MSDKSAVIKYAKLFCDKKYIESGYIAVRESDGILITAAGANLTELKEDDLVFVNDKNIDSFEGNFRAAAVILFCAIRQNKTAEAAAIVDSDNILKFSTKRKMLKPILDDLAQLCGISVKCASKNVAAEIVTSLSGQREACFMPDAGALVRGRSLEELLAVTAVLDKAAYADLIAESKGGCTQCLNMFTAYLEHVIYRMKTAKSVQKQESANSASESVKEENVEIKEPVAEETSEASDTPQAEGGEKVNADTENAESESVNTENAETASEQTDGNAEASAKSQSDESCEEKVVYKKFELDGNGVAILAHPYYSSVFSAMGKPFTVPDEYADELGEEIPCSPAILTCTKGAGKKITEVIGEAPACIIAQRGVVIRGKDEADALAVCKKLEEACKTYLA